MKYRKDVIGIQTCVKFFMRVSFCQINFWLSELYFETVNYMEILIILNVTRGTVRWDILTRRVKTYMPKEVKYFLLFFSLRLYATRQLHLHIKCAVNSFSPDDETQCSSDCSAILLLKK